MYVAPGGPVTFDAFPLSGSGAAAGAEFVHDGSTVTRSPGSRTPLTFDVPPLAR